MEHPMDSDTKPKIALHKFSSCDGCQLAFLNLGTGLLSVFEQFDVMHFAEAGPVAEDAEVLISFVEGSISTPDDLERIKKVRANSRYLITIGACATAGGLQALRNLTDNDGWLEAVYATPEFIHTLDRVTPVRAHVPVDVELWGCPVNSAQVINALHACHNGTLPVVEHDKVCLECKRRQTVCVMVTRNMPCMGPVTRTGCGALCPGCARDCYACYGPAENSEDAVLREHFTGLGMDSTQIEHRFASFNTAAGMTRKDLQGLAADDE
jgi:coenzyme F420-reducing hydrogenase gamma subunit